MARKPRGQVRTPGGPGPQPHSQPPRPQGGSSWASLRDAVRRDIEQAASALAFAASLHERLEAQRRLFADFPRVMEQLRSGALERVATALARLFEGKEQFDLTRFLRDLPLALGQLAAAEAARKSAPREPASPEAGAPPAAAGEEAAAAAEVPAEAATPASTDEAPASSDGTSTAAPGSTSIPTPVSIATPISTPPLSSPSPSTSPSTSPSPSTFPSTPTPTSTSTSVSDAAPPGNGAAAGQGGGHLPPHRGDRAARGGSQARPRSLALRPRGPGGSAPGGGLRPPALRRLRGSLGRSAHPAGQRRGDERGDGSLPRLDAAGALHGRRRAALAAAAAREALRQAARHAGLRGRGRTPGRGRDGARSLTETWHSAATSRILL